MQDHTSFLPPSPRGFAEFAWQSDYGQFYLVDGGEDGFLAPEEITPEMEARSLFAPASGLVVYTEGCMQQRIRLSIYDVEPGAEDTEYLSGNPWTRVETVEARFPSKRFSISSPSHPDPLPNGPLFFVDAEAVKIRISWMEFYGSRDDSVPVQPDVIEIRIWPA